MRFHAAPLSRSTCSRTTARGQSARGRARCRGARSRAHAGASPASSTSPRPFSSARRPTRASGPICGSSRRVRTSLRGPSDRRDGRAPCAPSTGMASRAPSRSGWKKRSASSPVPSRSTGDRARARRASACRACPSLGRGAGAGARAPGRSASSRGRSASTAMCRAATPAACPTISFRSPLSMRLPAQSRGRKPSTQVFGDSAPSCRLCLCPRPDQRAFPRAHVRAGHWASPRTRPPAPLRRPSRAL